MSDEEEQSNQQNEEDEEQEDQEENDDEQQDDGQDQQEGDQDQDQGSQAQSNQEQEGGQQQQGSGGDTQNDDEAKRELLPSFKAVQPDRFQFTNLLSQISSLSLGVDNFISSLPSHGGLQYRSYQVPAPVRIVSQLTQTPPIREERVVIMKDEDTQVSMQPQIVIQPTKIEKQPPEQSFKMSNESNKFLAQLYEENKKLKRWQNSSQPINSHQTGSSGGSGFYGSRERFQRQEYEKGLFNVQERNREIDQAIEMLKRGQNE